MSENNSSEGSSAMTFHETNENEGPKIRIWTQEDFDEQIKSFVAPLMRQLEDLTGHVQGLSVASVKNTPSDSTPDTVKRQQASILIPYQHTTGIMKKSHPFFSSPLIKNSSL